MKLNFEQPLRAVVGVHGGVVACLRDRDADVVQIRGGEPGRIGQPAERLAHDRKVRGLAR